MPMQRSKYPQDWEAISLYIRFERAGWKCEECGAPNHANIWRKPGTKEFVVVETLEDLAEIVRKNSGILLRDIVKVVLTTAHLGAPKPDGTPGDVHDKMDCRDENLKALCQYCHLLLDVKEHVENRRKTLERLQLEKQFDNGQQYMEGF